MTVVVDQALALWGLQGAHYTLAAARENAVYRVNTADQSFALRLHRKGYRTDAQLRSELQWMHASGQGGVTVPTPVAASSGAMLEVVDGTQVDVLNWLQGVPLAERFDALHAPQRATTLHDLGREMARLHTVCDQWTPPAGFTRPAWNIDGLLGETPLWDRFWDNPDLSTNERALLTTFRFFAIAQMTDLTPTLDYGLIHADLVPTNVMIHNGALALIDFDDGGHGYRLFEVATALLKHSDAGDFPALRAALLGGYRAVRPLDTARLDLFFALRACTYVGWNITRMAEDRQRNARFIRIALHCVRKVLDR